LSKWEVPANVEDLITLQTEMAIDGKPVPGYATLTAEQEAEVLYAFTDTTAITG
jgi:TP901-1 family phage major tail protein